MSGTAGLPPDSGRSRDRQGAPRFAPAAVARADRRLRALMPHSRLQGAVAEGNSGAQPEDRKWEMLRSAWSVTLVQ